MSAIVIGTIVFFGLLGLWAYHDIARQPSDADVKAQCTPSRPKLLTGYQQPAKRPRYEKNPARYQRQERPSKKYRWRGLERSLGEKVKRNKSS